MRTLQSRPYKVKTMHLAKRRTLDKKFHRSTGAGAVNAAIAASRQAAAVVIFPQFPSLPV